MCGIAFIYNQTLSPVELKRKAENSLTKLIHRGPDEGSIKLSGHACIAHRRLSIIDLSGSPQPMIDQSGRFHLTFNGEIYNYKDVRKRLLPRWDFKTSGDTEVLLAGLVLEGAEFLNCLEGMFAFGLWDSTQEKLILGRDRMGKKPLYYQSFSNNSFSCASELPALRELSEIGWQEDENSTADYLRYGYQLPGHTAWKNVQEVLPGHLLFWSPRSGVEIRKWWNLKAGQFEGTVEEASEILRENLLNAINLRLVADVEVGSFLSGGVDSSLISAIVRRHYKRPLKTFTIGFKDKKHDERSFARTVATAIGSEHYERVLADWDESDLEKLIIHHVGQPFGDTSLLPTAIVCELASNYVKVALSGDGADELFSGYQRYQARILLSWYTRLPKTVRSSIHRTIRFFPEPNAHHSRSLLKKSHLFLDIVEKKFAETPYVAPLQFSPALLSKLTPDLEGLGHGIPDIPETTEPGDLQRMLLADASIYLPQDILLKVDRASMAYSLESRAPFLDSKLVEFAFSLPHSWHRNGFKGKRMLSKAFGDFIPSSVWTRRKQGFSMPLQEWFRGKLGQKLRDFLVEDSGPFNAKETLKFLDEHSSKSRDHGFRLWLIYVYLLWRNSYSKV